MRDNLRDKMIGVSIDSISYSHDNQFKNRFEIKLLPDYNSRYFPPYHIRFLNISADLLEKDFLLWISRQNSELTEQQFSSLRAKGSVVQGGYYKIPSKYLTSEYSALNGYVVDSNNDIFEMVRIHPSQPIFQVHIPNSDAPFARFAWS